MYHKTWATKLFEFKTKNKGWKTQSCATTCFVNESKCHGKGNTQEKKTQRSNGDAKQKKCYKLKKPRNGVWDKKKICKQKTKKHDACAKRGQCQKLWLHTYYHHEIWWKG